MDGRKESLLKRWVSRGLVLIVLCYLTAHRLGLFEKRAVAIPVKDPFRNLVLNSGLEESEASNAIPHGWEFKISSGDYDSQAIELVKSSVQRPHSGRSVLEFGGSGGEATLLSNSCFVPGVSVVVCEGWIQTDLVRDCQITAFAQSLESAEPRLCSEIVTVDSSPGDWRAFQFFFGLDSPIADVPVQLAVRLSGEALVHLDDLSLKVLPHFVPEKIVADKGFESPDGDGTYPEWQYIADRKDGGCITIDESAHTGKHCTGIRGTGGWGVMVSRQSLPSGATEIIAQGFVKIKRGRGRLKIDYISLTGRCFGSSESEEGGENWTRVIAKSDPMLLARAHKVCVTLTATSSDGGPYDVYFDDVEVFAKY